MKVDARFCRVAFVGGALLVAMWSRNAAAEQVTYYEQIAPILRTNCVSCHSAAGTNIGSLVAPMSLTSYEEVRPWARAIANKVRTGEMPPWFADAPRGVFSNERGLTKEQVATIETWVDSGAAAGDKAKAPTPTLDTEAGSGGYSLGTPDLIVKMPAYFVNDDAQDVQGIFYSKIAEEQLPHDVFVRAWEFRAGTYLARRDTVHHMCGGVRLPEFVANADTAAAEGEDAAGLSLGCIAGGAEPVQLPDGFGMELKKGSSITFGMHYYKEAGPGTGYMNQAEVGFYFAKGPIKYKVQSKAIKPPEEFEIPPGKVNYRIGAAETLQKDTLYLAYWPHAHLRATAARYTATYPDGHQELLLNVPRYDQSWQVTYKLKEPKLLPKGTRVDVEMWYDNSANRAAKRRFNPNIVVHRGARTQDEMMDGFVSFVELEPGQEVPTPNTR